MISIVTPIKVFRVPRRTIECCFGIEMVTDDIVKMDYAPAVELIAYMKGEYTTQGMLCLSLPRLYKGKGHSTPLSTALGIAGVNPKCTTDAFTLVGSDNVYHNPMFSKHNLARHFLTIRDYIAQNPNTNYMNMTDFKQGDINNAIQSIMIPHCHEIYDNLPPIDVKLASIMDILTFLRPVSELHYMLVPILTGVPPSIFQNIASSLTMEQRCDLMEVDVLFRQLDPQILPLPQSGKGLAILATLKNFRDYLLVEPELFMMYPSYLFLNSWYSLDLASLPEMSTDHLIYKLLMQTTPDTVSIRRPIYKDMEKMQSFADHSGTATPYMKSIVLGALELILEKVQVLNLADMCRIMSMLEVYYVPLNGGQHLYAPYQVQHHTSNLISSTKWKKLRERLAILQEQAQTQAQTQAQAQP